MGKRYDILKVQRKFGLRVRELREKRGWTLEYCEERGWGNWRTLQAIESGRNVKLETIVRLANFFGISLRELMEDV